MIRLRFLMFFGCVTAFGCSDATRVRGVVLLTRWNVLEPAASVVVYALPAHNEIDRELAALCASDSLLAAIGALEVPIGPVRVQAEGVELDASLASARRGDRPNDDTVVKVAPWEKRDAYVAFRTRMDSLLRRTAIASARTSDSGRYQLLLPRPDSIELFAFSILDDRGAMLIWRDRVVGVGTHDLRKPVRRMHHVFCGEP